jgi:hypothetical protein
MKRFIALAFALALTAAMAIPAGAITPWRGVGR